MDTKKLYSLYIFILLSLPPLWSNNAFLNKLSVVADMDLELEIVQKTISCNNTADAFIIAKPNGGTAPYQYNWSTGDTLSTISDLAPGIYGLTVTDINGDTASTSVTISNPPTLTLDISKTNVTIENAADGTATPIINGGVAPYQFAWSNNSTDSLQNNLVEGIYVLTITDFNGCMLSDSVEIILSPVNCPSIDVMLNMTAPNCASDSTGALEVVPLTGLAPYTYLWETGDTNALLNNITAGTYMVTVTDANECSMGVSALLQDADSIKIDLMVKAGAGISDDTIIAMVTGGQMPYTYNWSNGSNNMSIQNLSSGTYELTITDNNACMQTASATIDAPSCNLGILSQNIDLDTISCRDKGELCLAIPLDSMINYSLQLNGSAINQFAGCLYDTSYAYSYFTLPGMGNSGPYVLDQWTVNGTNYSGDFVNINALVDSMNLWDVSGAWHLLSDILIIRGGLPQNNYGQMQIRTPDIIGSETHLDANTNYTPRGTLIEFEVGSHELILTEIATTCADTITINQACRNEKDTIIELALDLGSTDSISLESIFGNNITISDNLCSESSGTNATILLNTTKTTVQITTIEVGTDTACYQITANTGFIYNLSIIVHVEMETTDTICTSFIGIDTITNLAIGCDSFEICLPILYDSLLTYTIRNNGNPFTGNISTCDNNNGALTFMEAKRHQLVFTNTQNCADSILLAIHAPDCDKDLELKDTIEVDDTGRSCVEFVGLPGPFQSIRDLCPDKNGEMAMLSIDGLTGCIDYRGIELGVDTACIEVCDVFGFCDTVSLIIIVTSGDLPPPEFDAVNDSTETSVNDAVVLNALGNDIFTTLDDMYLVSQPANGTAVFNMDGTIRYEPMGDFCNDSIPDIFEYAICFENICDTATVSVLVKCTSNRDFVIYNGLSPNGDGINDIFLIEGIEDFPNNEVKIFNRWGNMVYSMKNYKNEWSGIWGNRNQQLPDGTYFYLFDNGEGKTYSGFLEIRR